jgi:hypothetical protein
MTKHTGPGEGVNVSPADITRANDETWEVTLKGSALHTALTYEVSEFDGKLYLHRLDLSELARHGPGRHDLVLRSHAEREIGRLTEERDGYQRFAEIEQSFRRAVEAIGDRRQRENEALREALEEWRTLMEQSDGVAGLHQNGDLATWDELTEGEYSDWLSTTHRLLATAPQQENDDAS